MATSRTVIVAGAGIAGLASALALARNGFRVTVLEQAERLEETGAGIQLSPNATRCLIDLGLGEKLRPHVVSPQTLRVRDARTGKDIVAMPLGVAAEQRHGAPYWSIHRGDLQAALVAAVTTQSAISVKLDMRVEDFVTDTDGVSVAARGSAGIAHERGMSLIAADGLWSIVRTRIGANDSPRFAGRAAYRALVPAAQVAPEFREPNVHLWLGREAHLVHYPVKGGSVINIVAIINDRWNAPGWSEPASRADLLPRFPESSWAEPARGLLGLPDAWLKWALHDRAPLTNWTLGPVALAGDAAHPMLPYLAQGAAMAIEDAVVAAHCLARSPDDPAAALRIYCLSRRARTRKVQRAAARNGVRYHFAGLRGLARNAAMRALGGERLSRHYDWIYDWRAPETSPTS